jgi:hypothetical protein
MGATTSCLKRSVGGVWQSALHFVLNERGEPRQIFLQAVLDQGEGEILEQIQIVRSLHIQDLTARTVGLDAGPMRDIRGFGSLGSSVIPSLKYRL